MSEPGHDAKNGDVSEYATTNAETRSGAHALRDRVRWLPAAANHRSNFDLSLPRWREVRPAFQGPQRE
jgi:hypothetical protein